MFLIFSVTLEARDGTFVGVSYLNSKLSSDTRYKSIEDDKSDGYKVEVGAYINSYLSVGFEFVDNGVFKAKLKNDLDSVTSLKSLSTNVSAHYPFFSEIVDTYAKLGFGEVIFEEDVDNYAHQSLKGAFAMYGFGVAFRAYEDYVLKLGYDREIFNILNTDSVKKVTQKDEMIIDRIYVGIEVQF